MRGPLWVGLCSDSGALRAIRLLLLASGFCMGVGGGSLAASPGAGRPLGFFFFFTCGCFFLEVICFLS